MPVIVAGHDSWELAELLSSFMLHLPFPSLDGFQGSQSSFCPYWFYHKNFKSPLYLLSFQSILGVNEDVNCELTIYLKEEGC